MNERYLRYYDRYSWRAMPRFLFDALLSRSRLRRLSLLNRQRDYLQLAQRPDLLALHRQLNTRLLAATREWASYDYGEGYFYQGFRRIGLTGLRDTEARVEGMGLRRMLAGRRVLEIGSNSGFIALSIAESAIEVAGFDINPHMVHVARDVASHLGLTNTRFEVSEFEDFAATGPYDAVLSFANHTTYDGNTRQTVEQYFARCRDLLTPGGMLLFESHAPDYEGAGLAGVIDTIRGMFSIHEQRILDAGTFLDRGRTFVVAEKTT